jgi:hypothetical protein
MLARTRFVTKLFVVRSIRRWRRRDDEPSSTGKLLLGRKLAGQPAASRH